MCVDPRRRVLPPTHKVCTNNDFNRCLKDAFHSFSKYNEGEVENERE